MPTTPGDDDHLFDRAVLSAIAIDGYRTQLSTTILFLEALADRLDGWAKESRSCGWSTHQVSANLSAADDCRRMAAELKR